MRQTIRLSLLLVLLVSGVLSAAPTAAQAPSADTGCWTGHYQGRAALWMYCVPPTWNGDLVVFAHGYTAPMAPLDFQNLDLPDGSYLPDLVQGLGFAFATTSYPKNGLAIVEGVADIQDLVRRFPAATGRSPKHVYIVGASEGGIVTTLLVENAPQMFSGGLAACGPIGDFRKQVNYWGDFRVLFDYFFPSALPPSPIDIPDTAIANWQTEMANIGIQLQQHQDKALQLIATSRAPVDPLQPGTVGETTLGILWYNVFATNEAKSELGGNPYDNRLRWYSGSLNDVLLNAAVQRFAARPAALAAIQAHYQTSGKLTRPLVTLHTTGDPIVPFWHEVLYALKAYPSKGGSLLPVPIVRYGHCTFTGNEMMAAFGLLYEQVNGQQPPGLKLHFNRDQVQKEWQKAKAEAAKAPEDR